MLNTTRNSVDGYDFHKTMHGETVFTNMVEEKVLSFKEGLKNYGDFWRIQAVLDEMVFKDEDEDEYDYVLEYFNGI